MKLVKVNSLGRNVAMYGNLKPDTWFSNMQETKPTNYKTDKGHMHIDDGTHIIAEDVCWRDNASVRVYDCELHYEVAE